LKENYFWWNLYCLLIKAPIKADIKVLMFDPKALSAIFLSLQVAKNLWGFGHVVAMNLTKLFITPSRIFFHYQKGISYT